METTINTPDEIFVEGDVSENTDHIDSSDTSALNTDVTADVSESDVTDASDETTPAVTEAA